MTVKMITSKLTKTMIKNPGLSFQIPITISVQDPNMGEYDERWRQHWFALIFHDDIETLELPYLPRYGIYLLKDIAEILLIAINWFNES